MNNEELEAKGIFQTHFRSQKSLSSMLSLLKARIPIFWIESTGNSIDPPRIKGIVTDHYSFTIAPVEDQPEVFYFKLQYVPGIDPATFDWDRKKRLVLETLGTQEIGH